MPLDQTSLSTPLKSTNSSSAGSDKSTSQDNGPHGIVSGIEDMLYAAAYSAVAQPLVGIAQLVTGGRVNSFFGLKGPTDDSLWTKAGDLTGNVADFLLISKGLGKIAPATFGADATISPFLRGGLTGGIFSMVMPTQQGGNFLLNKARSVVIGGGTFSAMDGLGSPLSKALGGSLSGDVLAGTLAGTSGGIASSGLTDLLYWRKPGSADLSNIAYYGAFGGIMGAAAHTPFFRPAQPPPAPGEPGTASGVTGGLDSTAAARSSSDTQSALNNELALGNGGTAAPLEAVPSEAASIKAAPSDSIVWTAKTLDNQDAIEQYFEAQAAKPEEEGGGQYQFQKGYYEVRMTHPMDRSTLLTTSENQMTVGEDLPLTHLPAVERTAVFTTEQGKAQITSDLTMADGTVIAKGTDLPNGVRVSADNVSEPEGDLFARKLSGNVELTVAQGKVTLSTGQVIASGRAQGEVTIDGGQTANPGDHIVLRPSTDDDGNPRIDTYPVNPKNFKKWVPVSGKSGYFAPDLSSAGPVQMVPVQSGDAIRFKTAWGDPATNDGPAFLAKYGEGDFNLITERDLRETYVGSNPQSSTRLDQIIARANFGRSTPVPTARGVVGADGVLHLT